MKKAVGIIIVCLNAKGTVKHYSRVFLVRTSNRIDKIFSSDKLSLTNVKLDITLDALLNVCLSRKHMYTRKRTDGPDTAVLRERKPQSLPAISDILPFRRTGGFDGGNA
jgi:hypothetical protein